MKSTYDKLNPVPTFKQGELVYTTCTLDDCSPSSVPPGGPAGTQTQVVLVTGPGPEICQFSGVLLFEFFNKNSPINRLGNHVEDWSKQRFQLFKDSLTLSN